MYCVKCGSGVPAEASFCAECGSPVYVARPAPGPVPTVAPPGSEEPTDLPTEVVRVAPQTLPTQRRGQTLANVTGVEASSAPSPPKPIGRAVRFISWAFLGLSVLSALHVLTADRPFSFVVSVPDVIDQKRITAAVVAVLCESTDTGETSAGSGVMLLTDGFVLTNSHVVPQDQQYLHTPAEGCLVVLPGQDSGSPSELYWATPIVVPRISEDYDLAHLQIHAAYRDEAGRQHGEYPRAFAALYDAEGLYVRTCGVDTDVQLGDPIRIFGYPGTSGSFRLTVTEGIISSRLEGGLIATSAKVDEGNSGGLAIDKRGCIVGVPSAVLKGKYENLGVIIPTRLIREFQTKITAKEK